jgi:hypothetical protein
MRKLSTLFALWASLNACAGSDLIALTPEASRIEVITAEPDRAAYDFVGEVHGSAKGGLEEANENARNDIRNRAARLGATLVKLDTTTAANAMDWTGRNQVVLTGRAFRPKAVATQ